MNGPNNMIWCSSCEAVRPILTDDMPGTDVTGQFHNPRDLVCGDCRLVIATTYRSGPPPQSGDCQ